MEIAPITETLLAYARENLAWLKDDGFEETKASLGRSGFTLYLLGPHAGIVFVCDVGRSTVTVFIGPPRHPRTVDVTAVLAVRNLPAASPKIDANSLQSRRASVTRHTEALKLLRETELAGDWSRLDLAQEETRRMRERQLREMSHAMNSPAMRKVVEAVGRESTEPNTTE